MYRGRNDIDQEVLPRGQMDCVISSTVNRGVLERKSSLGRMAKDKHDSSVALFDQNILHG